MHMLKIVIVEINLKHESDCFQCVEIEVDEKDPTSQWSLYRVI